MCGTLYPSVLGTVATTPSFEETSHLREEGASGQKGAGLQVAALCETISLKIPKSYVMKGNRYPTNWKEIALAIKESADWKCRHCGTLCRRPGEQKQLAITKTEIARHTLDVHHANCIPEDNRVENLIPLCKPCHISLHAGRYSNITPGQLSLFEEPLVTKNV